jgi:hypothetical protein
MEASWSSLVRVRCAGRAARLQSGTASFIMQVLGMLIIDPVGHH